MALNDIWSVLGHSSFLSGGSLILLLTFIQLSPLKINPWSWLGKVIGRMINGELLAKVDKIDVEIHGVKEKLAEQEAVNSRVRILRFGDECLHNVKHTKEHFDQTLDDITRYNNYCSTHPTFQNDITTLTSARIEEIYRKCLRDNDFL